MFFKSCILLVLSAVWAAAPAVAQMRILPLGDSITQGGQTYVSYRYPLWFELAASGFDVDFVGLQNTLNNNSTPDNTLYPLYFSQFDRDHAGYWGWRTDEIAGIIDSIATNTLPDVVLLHLGTNDIGQMGAAGVSNADTYLRDIIASLRTAQSDVVVLLAQVIDIGVGSGYGANADQVAPLNATIVQVAADLHTTMSPVVVVDQNSGFDLATMMQADQLHPNEVGESQMAAVWLAALTPWLPAGNPAPTVSLTEPVAGAGFVEPAEIQLSADASDPNGSVVAVRFYANDQLLFSDPSEPFAYLWSGVGSGAYSLRAEAEDDEGRVTSTALLSVSVVPEGEGVALPLMNSSFEFPSLPDSELVAGPGTLEGWEFIATPNTFTGIFNPPSGSYSSAAGGASPVGADGANVAYLFNDGGPLESVSATQPLLNVLEAGSTYVLTVAIGKFLPNQPYSFSTYGGYTIELLAGNQVIASDSDSIDPAVDSFQDAFCQVSSDDVPPSLLGQALAVRLGISANEADRSTHFDNVRLTRQDIAVSIPESPRHVPLQVRPNPFNPATEVVWTQRSAGRVTLELFDARGRRVQLVLHQQVLPAGLHTVALRPQLPTGVYLLRLRTPNLTETKPITLLK